MYLDAGTTYSKIISTGEAVDRLVPVKIINNMSYYLLESKRLKDIPLKIKSACGHMTGSDTHENEIKIYSYDCFARCFIL